MEDVDADDVLFDFGSDADVKGMINLTFSGLDLEDEEKTLHNQQADGFLTNDLQVTNDRLDAQESHVLSDQMEYTHVDLSEIISPARPNIQPDIYTGPVLHDLNHEAPAIVSVPPDSSQTGLQTESAESVHNGSDMNIGDSSCESIEIRHSANLDDIEFNFDTEPSGTTDGLLTALHSTNQHPSTDVDSPQQPAHPTSSTHEPLLSPCLPPQTSTVPSDISPATHSHSFPPSDTGYADDNLPISISISKDSDDAERGNCMVDDNRLLLTNELSGKHATDDEADFDFELPDRPMTQEKSSDMDDEFDFEMAPKVAIKQVSSNDLEMIPGTHEPAPSVVHQVPLSPEHSPQPMTAQSAAPSIFLVSSIQPAVPEADESAVPIGDTDVMLKDVDEAEAIWNSVATVTPTICETMEGSRASESRRPLVGYGQFYDHCRQSNWEIHKDGITTQVHYTGLACVKQFFFGPPQLHTQLLEERDMVFCLAACKLNNDVPIHIQVLQTLHRKLTGSKFDCPRFGSHWEDIGFQGNDPATDLRSAGLLGLLQLLFLVTNGKTAALARDIYKLSLHETQNFPFCIMGINMTRISLQTLREAHLNKECNKQNMVLNIVNDFYAATFYHLYNIWKTQRKTIADTGFVMKDVENYAKKHPKALMDNLSSFLDKKKSMVTSEGRFDSQDQSEGGGVGHMTFMDVCAE